MDGNWAKWMMIRCGGDLSTPILCWPSVLVVSFSLPYIGLTWLLYVARLYSKGRILGHKRAKRNTRPNTTLLQIEGVSTKEDAQFYLGKVRTSCIYEGCEDLSSCCLSVLHTFTERRRRLRDLTFALSGGALLLSVPLCVHLIRSPRPYTDVSLVLTVTLAS